jgi:Putative transposase of IS4/5 family (DUF4096)
LLPPRPRHPLGCHNPRVPDRAAMDAIFFVLRTGSQWGALSATGICSKSSAHRRFTEWVKAGVFHQGRRMKAFGPFLSAACGHNQRRHRSRPRQIDFKEMAAPTSEEVNHRTRARSTWPLLVICTGMR